MTPSSSPAGATSPAPSSTALLKTLTALALVVAFCAAAFAWYERRHPRVFIQTVPQDASLRDKFLAAYYSTDVWERTYWMGVPSLQTPTDNWSMQEILWEIKPDFVIETGTYNGGTSLYYAALLSIIGDKGKVITVDIDDSRIGEASQRKLWKERVEFIKGSSVDKAVSDRIRREVEGHSVVVTLDALHTRDHVFKELEIYSQLVPVGSYLVVQDTSVGHPILADAGPGPMEAVQDFLKTHDNFVVDRSREKFLLTFYPSGWLKRVR